MQLLKLLLTLSLVLMLSECQRVEHLEDENAIQVHGKLFIIGGGKRPVPLVDRMITESGVDKTGYILILPMASAEEDSAVYYSSKQFSDRGIDSIHFVLSTLATDDPDSASQLISQASLIYISGGDQNRFMRLIEGTPLKASLVNAYLSGATIAGTSAGAAVMSNKMITGNEIKHPVYTGRFPTIEANNIEVKPGLGLLDQVIIDQHFVKRQRLNRLITVCLEHPESTGIGIDESTALLVKGGVGEVVGEGQVILLKHVRAETKVVNGLLGGEGLNLSIYLPGDTLDI